LLFRVSVLGDGHRLGAAVGHNGLFAGQIGRWTLPERHRRGEQDRGGKRVWSAQ
jgi:hypothetical protein